MKKYSPEELLKLGIIDEDGFNTLKSKETTKRESKLSLNLFFNILAGILFGLGIIWVVAANWTSIPDYIILAFLLIGSAASLFALWKFRKKELTLEIWSIVYAAFCIGTIAYIGQYFNVASNTELFLFLCLLIIAFISFYSKSILLSNAYLILGAIYFIFVDEFFADALNIPTLVGTHDFTFWLRMLNPLVYGVIPLLYIKYFGKTENAQTKYETKLFNFIDQRYKWIFFDAFIIVFVFALLPDIDNFAEVSLLGILLLALTYNSEHNKAYWLIKMASIVALLITSCNGLYTNGGVGLSIIPIALGILYHVPRIKIDLWKKFKEAKNNKDDKLLNLEVYKGKDLMFVWTGLFLLALDTWFEFIFEKNFHWSVYLLFVIIYAIYSIVDGIRNSRMKEFSFGEILIAFEIFRFIFAFEDDLMIRGISAIIIAAVILIINKKATKIIKLADAEGGKNE